MKNAVWHSALALLVVTGGLLGLSLPFGKLATEAGASAVLWSFVVSFGAGGVLLAVMLARGQRVGLRPGKLRYFFITAAISYAIPNLLSFSVIPHLGAGYTGLMFTLSPVITLAMSTAAGLRRPSALGAAGIAVGFVGAVLVASTRGAMGGNGSLGWVAAGLMIPVFLAAGNIYRTLDLPPDAGPIELAVGSHLASALILLLALLATGQGASLALLGQVPLLVAAQMAAAAAMFVFFFRLQIVGGPVYLSQIGYVAAAVALISGTLFLGERYQALTWLGAAVITIGIVMTTLAQRAAAKSASGG